MRVLDAAGAMLGVLSISEAIQMAVRNGLDLVEVSPNAEPPVCRIMDYGKFKYEQSRKEREARKHQHGGEMKEIKFHANVADHDFRTKVNHITGFLDRGIKVKASLYFRGRENAHRELGFEVMNRVLKETEELSTVDMAPRLIGNSIVMVLSPRPNRPPSRADREAAPAAPPTPRPAAVPTPVSPIQAPVPTLGDAMPSLSSS